MPRSGDDSRPVGVLLAGGLARRMGGGDKPLRLLSGRPLVSYVIERITPQTRALALSANGDPARFADWNLPVIADPLPGHPGPLAGILAGMAWARACHPECTDLLSVPADAPFLPLDLVAQLAAARANAQAEIAVAASGERRHGVVALWPTRLAADLHTAVADDGLRKVDGFLARYTVAVAHFAMEPVDPFFNINDPAALADAHQMLGKI
jgi:molybdopterin-guanine dinucleotide biosynthesis protein A